MYKVYKQPSSTESKKMEKETNIWKQIIVDSHIKIFR